MWEGKIMQIKDIKRETKYKCNWKTNRNEIERKCPLKRFQ